MRLILDTHVWLWIHLAPDRLAPTVRRLLENTDNELWLSPISVWETLQLGRKGRLELPPDPEEWVRQRVVEQPVRDAHLTREIAMAGHRLELATKDPADRLIAATAMVADLRLVTSDRALLAASEVPTIAAA
ncbi:MAG: type II toxin-antitoxin system VapC family toxin [Candidatus Dormibacteraeota bacterium]|nr:type II toxin-antitoxin system VapC family toxin [Candidatus Dormibacteraeota bacterium]MBV9525727.1 type II toxin-antitoxin system VapC family toxin [Candidatus Dormibacteraeota bacterium]